MEDTNVDTNVDTNSTLSFQPYIYSISDNVGYVGSFYSISDIEDVIKKYPLMKFIVYCFKTTKPTTVDLSTTVWIILYHTTDAVAYVTNCREDAVKVQQTYLKVGLTYEDDVDYWKQPIGLSPSAVERLELLHTIRDKDLIEIELNKMLEKLNVSTQFIPDGPIEKMIKENEQQLRENEKITIMDCIVPFVLNSLILEQQEQQEQQINFPIDSPYVRVHITNEEPMPDLNPEEIEKMFKSVVEL